MRSVSHNSELKTAFSQCRRRCMEVHKVEASDVSLARGRVSACAGWSQVCPMVGHVARMNRGSRGRTDAAAIDCGLARASQTSSNNLKGGGARAKLRLSESRSLVSHLNPQSAICWPPLSHVDRLGLRWLAATAFTATLTDPNRHLRPQNHFTLPSDRDSPTLTLTCIASLLLHA